jgi:hypothetical protein
MGLAFALATPLFASASGLRIGVADTINNSSGGALIAVPSAGTVFLSDTNSATVSGKTISGASNTLQAIPAATALSGQVPVANGGTGDSTLTLNGILFGNGTSSVGATAAGSQYQLLQAGSGGVPAFGALQLSQSAAVSGALGIANGGTGQTTASGAINALLPSQTGDSGYYLTTNGTVASWAQVPATSPNIVGSQASPSSITATSGIPFSGSNFSNTIFVAGSGGAVSVTANPQITAGTAVGQHLRVNGTSASNTVSLADGNGLSLNGPIVLNNNGAIDFDWNGSVWYETSRR